MNGHRLQFVGQGGGEGGCAVQHHRQTFTVGTVHGVQGGFGIDRKAPGFRPGDISHHVRGADLAHIDEVRRAQPLKSSLVMIVVGVIETASLY